MQLRPLDGANTATQGYTEVRYDEEKKRVVSEPLQLSQAFRNFGELRTSRSSLRKLTHALAIGKRALSARGNKQGRVCRQGRRRSDSSSLSHPRKRSQRNRPKLLVNISSRHCAVQQNECSVCSVCSVCSLRACYDMREHYKYNIMIS